MLIHSRYTKRNRQPILHTLHLSQTSLDPLSLLLILHSSPFYLSAISSGWSLSSYTAAGNLWTTLASSPNYIPGSPLTAFVPSPAPNSGSK